MPGCWLLFPNFARHQPSEVKRDAGSPVIPKIHSWKVILCLRVLLRKISGLLAMVETLAVISSTVEQHEDVIEKCRQGG